MTILNLSPFLGIIHNGELNGDWDSLMIPFFKRFSVSYNANSLCFSGNLCDRKLMIFPVLSTISCSVRFIHGKVSVSSEKTS